MSSIIIKTILVLFVVSSCNDNKETATVTKDTDSTGVRSSDNTADQKTGTVDNILSAYLSVKNALSGDNTQEAANAATQITASVNGFNTASLSADQAKVYNEVVDDIKEHAEHIKDNSSNIVHQREHFELLSQDMIDLIKSTGSKQTLYMDFCPMYNNKKGASWLSEAKEIKNPYYGKEMLTCGEVKEEIKGKG